MTSKLLNWKGSHAEQMGVRLSLSIIAVLIGNMMRLRKPCKPPCNVFNKTVHICKNNTHVITYFCLLADEQHKMHNACTSN